MGLKKFHKRYYFFANCQTRVIQEIYEENGICFLFKGFEKVCFQKFTVFNDSNLKISSEKILFQKKNVYFVGQAKCLKILKKK